MPNCKRCGTTISEDEYEDFYGYCTTCAQIMAKHNYRVTNRAYGTKKKPLFSRCATFMAIIFGIAIVTIIISSIVFIFL